MNKRGQELSTSTIILIILGVIILVVLVIGFTIGWNKIIPYVSQSNINTVSTQCLSACSTASVYDFCSRTFDLNSGTTTIRNSTCNYLAQKQTQYGITPCTAIPCSNILFFDNTHNQYKTIADLSNSQCATNSGKTLQALIGDTVQSITCP
jgi:hypothetical protein